MEKSPNRSPKRKALTEDVVIREYIDSFRASSDRVRWVLYALVVVSAGVAAMTWNLRPEGMAMKQLQEFKETAKKKAEHDFEADKVAERQLSTETDDKRVAGLRKVVEDYETSAEYARQVVARSELVAVPLLFGTSFDSRDLGLVSGVTLNLLLLLMAFCLSRQHENLILCRFKIRRLCEKDPYHSDGDSSANFLYHALEMTQLFNDPPTLARWDNGLGGVMRSCYRIGLLTLAAMVYFYRIVADHQLGLSDDRMRVEYLLFVILFGHTLVSFLYGVACNQKWSITFFEINPQLRSEPATLWVRWLGLWPPPYWLRKKREKAIYHALRSNEVKPEEPARRSDQVVEVIQTVRISNGARKALLRGNRWRTALVARKMARVLYHAAARKAHEGRPDLRSDVRIGPGPEVTASAVGKGKWTVRATFPYTRIARPDDDGSVPPRVLAESAPAYPNSNETEDERQE